MGAERLYIHEGEFTVWMSSRGMANSRIPGEAALFLPVSRGLSISQCASQLHSSLRLDHV